MFTDGFISQLVTGATWVPHWCQVKFCTEFIEFFDI